jgi:hypothetical protein
MMLSPSSTQMTYRLAVAQAFTKLADQAAVCLLADAELPGDDGDRAALCQLDLRLPQLVNDLFCRESLPAH